MNQETTLSKLRDMKDQTFIYRDVKAVIKSFGHEGGLYLIRVDLDGISSQFEKTEKEIELFLLNFRPVPVLKIEENKPVPIENQELLPQQGRVELPIPEFINKHNETFSKLTDRLLEDIDRVRENPEYIKQAHVVSNLSNAVINIAKLELDAFVKINSL